MSRLSAWELFLNRDLMGRGRMTGKGANPKANAAVEALFGGPLAHWQVNKALYEQYGGRVVAHRNLGYYEPVKAQLRLLQEMEGRKEVEFYDPQVRADILEYFNRMLTGAVEINESFVVREGMKQPWERPFWKTKQKMETVPGSQETGNKGK